MSTVNNSKIATDRVNIIIAIKVKVIHILMVII